MIQIKSAKGPVAGPPNIGGTREVSRHRSSVLRVFIRSDEGSFLGACRSHAQMVVTGFTPLAAPRVDVPD